MPKAVLPRKPVENWEQVRDEWVAAVTRFVADAERWAAERGWGTLRDERTIAEDQIGTYTVPVLMVHTMQGRVVLSPEARFVWGGDGLIDLSVYPSLESSASIVREAGAWRVKRPDEDDPGKPWDAEAFAAEVRRLLEPA